MPKLSLRDATPNDAAAIVAIWNPIILDTVITFNPVRRSITEIEEMIISRRTDGHAFLIAQDGADVMGFACYAQFRGGLGYARCMEHTINLAPAARGKGAGRTLLLALEQHAATAGHHVMVAAVTGSNAASVSFHEKLGYTTVGTMSQVGWKFDVFHDLVLMQKFL